MSSQKSPPDLSPLLAGIPAPDAKNITLRVDRSAERALRKRHPWLFEEGIREQQREGKAGDHAVIFDRNRNFLALGLYDPRSSIRVRILHAGKPTPVDAEFFRRRFSKLVARRKPLLNKDTDGYRLINGENEGMPGFTLDRYADTLVLKLYTPAWVPHLPMLIPLLLEVQPVARLVLRLSREVMKRKEELFGLKDGAILAGPALTGPVLFKENGLQFECDPLRGQKTGFFLDQRENRERVEALASGKEVLNVFSYTGGFSLYAARGGARKVVSLDISKPALAAAERNFALNQGDTRVVAAKHEILAADAFKGLQALAEQKRRFDLVVIDPPSFAKKQAEVKNALEAYERLVRLGIRVLRSGGHLVMASCSARVSAENFFNVVHREAQKVGRPIDEVSRSGHALDHPVGFPEGEYLKCLFGIVA
ncbi:MAG: class I SAM-dependent methyltransferase [Deltaproteobacteria bacterium]|nr:class I SAM-dependent methyltransferase [Deltaproteobacteria bacterium]